MNASPLVSTPERLLQRLEWTVIRRLDGLLQGDYRTLFYGYSVDLAGLREYQVTDDVRHIDWNVTARLGTPYVRQYTEDRELTAWFVMDLSPSIDFGTALRYPQKRAVAIDLVATLARLLTRHGNRVGALLAGSPAVETLPARPGRPHVLQLVDHLLERPSLPPAAFTDLSPLLQYSGHTLRRRSLIILVSDFICAPGWEAGLRQLAQRHEVLAVHLWDPREMELPAVGPVILEDAETGEQMYVDTQDVHFRRRYAAAAAARVDALQQSVRQAGVPLLSLSTAEDLVPALVRLATLRRQWRRRP